MRLRRFIAPVILLAPTLLIVAGLFVIPLGILGRYSLYEARPGGIVIPAWVLDNYRRFLFDRFYLGILWKTASMSLWVTTLCLILGYPVAYFLARTRSRLVRAVGVTMLLVPLMTSVVVRSYGWTVLFSLLNGPLSKLYLALGLAPDAAQLAFTLRGAIIALVEVFLPFMALSIMPVLQGVDPSLEEASRSLGGGPLATFRRIIVPLSMPGVVAGSILVFVLSMNSFAIPSLVGGPRVQVVPILVYQQALSLFNWPFGAAVAIILLIVVLVLTGVQDRVLGGRSSLDSGVIS